MTSSREYTSKKASRSESSQDRSSRRRVRSSSIPPTVAPRAPSGSLEVGVEVAGQGLGVVGGAVDVGGGPSAEHRQAEDVESGGAGDDAAVVADAALTVADGEVEPGVVGAEAGGPQH